MRILLVEDDVLLGDAIVAGLERTGFAVDWVRDGQSGSAAMRIGEHAAVVLDLGLPRLAGLEVLKRARGAGNATPVLILTAQDSIDDKIRGLDSGADDYLVKPVDLDELAARLRSLIRRSQGQAAPELRVGEVSLQPASRQVMYRGSPVELSAREFAVLHELMLAAGRVLTRQQIEHSLYAWGEEIESNAVEVYIHYLRRKLQPEVIRTIRGVGYMMPKPPGG
jgi:DNA-binding response OmpR family regulator